MVRNIREKKIRGKKFSSMQPIDENFLTPNISYMHTYMYIKLSFTILPFVTYAALIRMKSHVSDHVLQTEKKQLCTRVPRLQLLVRPRTWCAKGSQMMNMIDTL